MFGLLDWEETDNKFIGKSKCEKYLAEAHFENDAWHYIIYKNGIEYYSGKDSAPNETLEDVKKVIQDLVSLNFAHI